MTYMLKYQRNFDFPIHDPFNYCHVNNTVLTCLFRQNYEQFTEKIEIILADLCFYVTLLLLYLLRSSWAGYCLQKMHLNLIK